MGSLRATLRAATLANRFLGYIVTVILTGYAKNRENSNGNDLINITEI